LGQTVLRIGHFLLLGACAIAIAACSSSNNVRKADNAYSPRVVKPGQPVPQGGGSYKIGKPYTIRGVRYVPREQPSYDKTGIASWYGEDFHGRLTANGEVYNMHAFTAAHTTLPLPSYARVTNIANGRSVVVRINDRGPFAKGRIIDLSRQTAKVLDFKHAGVARVRVQYVGRAPLDGEDNWLTTTVRENGTNERVAALDRKLAARAFASDGARGDKRRLKRTAEKAYRGRGNVRMFAQNEPLRATANRRARRNAPPVPKVGIPGETVAPVVQAAAHVAGTGTGTLGTLVVPASAAAERSPVALQNTIDTQGADEAARLASIAPSGAHVFEAGAFRDPQDAHALAARMDSVGTAQIEPATRDGERVFVVRVTVDPYAAN